MNLWGKCTLGSELKKKEENVLCLMDSANKGLIFFKRSEPQIISGIQIYGYILQDPWGSAPLKNIRPLLAEKISEDTQNFEKGFRDLGSNPSKNQISCLESL